MLKGDIYKIMKKTKLLALASVLLVAGLVSCGGKKDSSSAPATSDAATTVNPTSEKPATSETATTSEAPAPTTSQTTTSEAPAPTTSNATVDYETTPSVAFSADTYFKGVGGTWEEGSDGKFACNPKDQVLAAETQLANGVKYFNPSSKAYIDYSKKTYNGNTYYTRINAKSEKNYMTIEVSKAAKLEMMVGNSAKADAAKPDRTLTIVNEDTGATAYTGAIPNATEASTHFVSCVLPAAGTYSIKVAGGSYYVWFANAYLAK